MESVDRTALTHELHGCFASDRWVEQMLAEWPYDSVEEVRVAAAGAVRDLPRDEVHDFLARSRHDHSLLSAREEAVRLADSEPDEAASDDRDDLKAYADGAATYEERFDRMFVINDRGRKPDELIDELQRRLLLDNESELAEAQDELAAIVAERAVERFAG